MQFLVYNCVLKTVKQGTTTPHVREAGTIKCWHVWSLIHLNLVRLINDY